MTVVARAIYPREFDAALEKAMKKIDEAGKVIVNKTMTIGDGMLAILFELEDKKVNNGSGTKAKNGARKASGGKAKTETGATA